MNDLNRPPKSRDDQRHIFSFLQKLGFVVPDHGTIQELAQKHPMNRQIVVRMDRGDTDCMSILKGLNRFPARYACMLVETDDPQICSTRMVQIGKRQFWFDFFSKNHWKATHGQFRCKHVTTCYNYHSKIHLPTFSIDFVRAGSMYAVDFNPAPHTRKTPLRDMVTRDEVRSLIREAMRDFDEGVICQSKS